MGLGHKVALRYKVLGPGMTRLVDGGPGHKNRWGECLEACSLAHLSSAAFSIPGKDKPSRGSVSPQVSQKIRQVDVQAQEEALAVLHPWLLAAAIRSRTLGEPQRDSPP